MASQVGVTCINQKKSSFIWKIPEFSNLKLRFDCTINKCDVYGNNIETIKEIIRSPEFPIGLEELKWSLVFYRSRCVSENNAIRRGTSRGGTSTFNYVGFQLICSNNKKYTYFNTSVVLKIKDGKTGFLIAELKKLGPVKISESSSSSELFKFLSSDNAHWIDSLMTYNEVIVLCEYTLSDPKTDTMSVWSINQAAKMNQFPVEPLKELWKNKRFCDFELIAPCGRKLCAHRCILAARSQVFDAMFTTDMIEKKNQSVKITDISYEALEAMLNFFYSGKIDKLDHNLVSDVLTAAEKYQIQDLKEECQYFLSNTLSINNAMQTLKLSKTFGMADLEKLANDFVKSNAKEVLINNILQSNDDKDLIQQMSLLLK